MAQPERASKDLLSTPPRHPPTILAFLGLCACYVLLRPIDDLDLFTQITLGALAWQRGELISVEPLSYLHLGEPVVNPGWLSQVIFYGLYAGGGWNLLRAVYALLFAAALTLPLIGRQVLDRPHRPRLIAQAFALLLALAMVGSNTSVRAQGISLLCFSTLLVLRRSSMPLRIRLLWFTPVALLWQNSHLSLSLAVVWLLVHALGLILEQGISRARPILVETSAFLGVCVLCIFLTPDGTAVLEVARRGMEVSYQVLGISEWMAPWHPLVRDAMSGFWCALAVTALLAARVPRLVWRWHSIELAAFFLLTLWSARFALYLAPIAIPFWAAWIDAALPHLRSRGGRSRLPRRLGDFALMCMVILPVAVLPATPPLDPSLPLAQTAEVTKQVGSGRIYNYREWGGLISFAAGPAITVALDGRLYHYSDEIWSRYHAEARGEVPLAAIVAIHNPRAFVLHRTYHARLIALLDQSTEWVRADHDGDFVAFLPSAKGS